jgi:hypothetical protein
MLEANSLPNLQKVGFGRQSGEVITGPLHRLAEIVLRDDVVAGEDGWGSMAGNLPCHVRVAAFSKPKMWTASLFYALSDIDADHDGDCLCPF